MRCYANAGTSCGPVSVSVSLCLSQIGVLSIFLRINLPNFVQFKRYQGRSNFEMIIYVLCTLCTLGLPSFNTVLAYLLMLQFRLRSSGLTAKKVKGKVFPYSLPSVGPGADTGVQAVSPQVTWSESRHIPSSSLPLLSARPAFTFVALTRWRYL